MITEEKINAVRKLLKSGVPQGELYNNLLNEGYTTEEIGKIFFDASVKKAERKKSSSYEIHYFSLIGVALIITGIAIHAYPTWLLGFGTISIIAGVICLGVGLYISTNKR
jgi:hypothetical protein